MPRIKEKDDNQILDEALKIIVKIGPTQFSLAQVGEHVGLSPATLLQRFGSKNNLLVKAISHSNQRMKDQLEQQIIEFSTKLKFRSCVETVTELYCQFAVGVKEPRDVAHGLDILKFDILDPALNKVSKEYFEIRASAIEKLLRLGKKNGEITWSGDIPTLVQVLESVWQGAIILWAITPKGSVVTQLRKQIKAVLPK